MSMTGTAIRLCEEFLHRKPFFLSCICIIRRKIYLQTIVDESNSLVHEYFVLKCKILTVSCLQTPLQFIFKFNITVMLMFENTLYAFPISITRSNSGDLYAPVKHTSRKQLRTQKTQPSLWVSCQGTKH
jgi:hypothetical protein